ncbi:sensor histidine kinase [Actinomadura flavalba]|uniref:sensor histidine kinase n=1 Tax=Actinomadura flavalba TaxID=1120938 RepID=UPI00035D5A41|nr:ATP-binding protein [Actinomadura flavalba]
MTQAPPDGTREAPAEESSAAPEPEVSNPPVLLAPRAPQERAGLSRLSLVQLYRAGALLLAVLLLAAMSQAVFALVGNSDARSTLIGRVDPAMLEQFQHTGALARQDTTIRAYAASGDRADLAEYREAVATQRAAAERIRRLLTGVEGADEALARLRAIAAGAAEWRRTFAEPIAAGPGGQEIPAALESAGRTGFAQIRAEIAGMQLGLTSVHHRTAEHLRERGNVTTWSVVGALIIVVLAAVALAVFLRRTVLTPVSSLSRNVQAVAQGDFTHDLDVKGPYEITELAAIIDAMRHRIIEEWLATAEARQQLHSQTEELRRSNAELEQFAYVASHDLQEPLRKVASFCQMIERRYGDQLDDRGRQYIEFAVDGAKRMQALINDLLGFSRVGRMVRPEEAIDLNTVAEQAVGNLATLREETGADVRLGDLPTLPGDRTQLGQLFQNLIGNAIKFRRPDAPPVVEITAEREGDTWLFSCTDNGIGVDAKYSDRIFLIFQRLHPKDEYTGTGIGLALCKKIVEFHGGRIWLETEGRGDSPGTTIRWTLPAEKENDDDD